MNIRGRKLTDVLALVLIYALTAVLFVLQQKLLTVLCLVFSCYWSYIVLSKETYDRYQEKGRARRELLADRFGLWRLPVSWGWVVLLCLPLALLEVLSDAAFLIVMGVCWAAALIWYGLLSRWVRKRQPAREEPNQADQPEAGRRLPPRRRDHRGFL